MKIENIRNRQLVEWYEDWVRIWHYEPCEPAPRPPFEKDDIEYEILRRMKEFDYLDNCCSDNE
jgi:hypothetical protein